MTTPDRAGSALREANARACLLALRDGRDGAAGVPGASSVSELASATGLSRPTVDAVLADLVTTGLVSPAAREDQTAPGVPATAPGRPARRFAFAPHAASAVAVDVGARSVGALRADASGTILSRTSVEVGSLQDPTDVPDGQDEPSGQDGAGVEGIVRAIERVCDPEPDLPRATDAAAVRGAPSSVAIAVPGILGADGRIAQSLAAPRLVGLDLVGMLEERFGCPVTLENDIKLAAYAEHHLDPAASDTVLVQIGHRISVALILDGRILQGAHRQAGELGIQRGMRWTSTSERGRLRWSTGDLAEPLLRRAADGDAAAIAEVDAFCAEIAPRLAGLLLTVDPERVVVGGGLSRAGEVLLGPLRWHVHRLLMTVERPRIDAARLGADASLIGALGRAFEHGSARVSGVVGVPAPWPRLIAGIATPTADAGREIVLPGPDRPTGPTAARKVDP